MWLRLVVVGAVAWGAYDHWSDRALERPPGVVAQAEPVQRALDAPIAAIEQAGHTLTPVAHFEVNARVLGRDTYRFDAGAKLAPVDLALGWGPMSDSAVLENIDVGQVARAYYWRATAFPIPREAIERHSANMHLIPATREIERRLRKVRVGQVVTFTGYLVSARAADRRGGWNTSLTRADTGAGACELVYVTAFAVEPA